MHHRMLEIFQIAVAVARLETSLKCWSLQQNAGDLVTRYSTLLYISFKQMEKTLEFVMKLRFKKREA